MPLDYGLWMELTQALSCHQSSPHYTELLSLNAHKPSILLLATLADRLLRTVAALPWLFPPRTASTTISSTSTSITRSNNWHDRGSATAVKLYGGETDTYPGFSFTGYW